MSGAIFFTQRVVSVWNKLPEVVVEAGTILYFKKHSDSYMGTMGMEGCGPNASNQDQLRGLKKKGGMDKLGRRACFHAVNPYDSMSAMWVSSGCSGFFAQDERHAGQVHWPC